MLPDYYAKLKKHSFIHYFVKERIDPLRKHHMMKMYKWRQNSMYSNIGS